LRIIIEKRKKISNILHPLIEGGLLNKKAIIIIAPPVKAYSKQNGRKKIVIT